MECKYKWKFSLISSQQAACRWKIHIPLSKNKTSVKKIYSNGNFKNSCFGFHQETIKPLSLRPRGFKCFLVFDTNLQETSRQAGQVLLESDTRISDHKIGNSVPYSRFRTVRLSSPWKSSGTFLSTCRLSNARSFSQWDPYLKNMTVCFVNLKDIQKTILVYRTFYDTIKRK